MSMQRRSRGCIAFATAVALGACFSSNIWPARGADGAGQLVAIPPGKDTDIKLYASGGEIARGEPALQGMGSAGLVVWLAGNQFFAMDEVIAAFRKENPGISVGLITLPPGLILQAIKAGGWTYGGTRAELRPDIYGSVNLGHLKDLKSAGLMQDFMTYMHNELQILVEKGNPKRIGGINDLGRSDVRTSMPNPINEGIMQFYARKVLERHGIWNQLSGGKECASCQ